MNTDPHHDQPVRNLGVPIGEARGAVILLHGRGASSEDILSLADDLVQSDVVFLAPQAAGNSWYPYPFLSPLEKNEPWLGSALDLVKRLFEDLAAYGVPREKIVIAGFSQGACLATEYFARSAASPCGGLISFTGGLIGPQGTQFRYTGDLKGTPAFLGAGDPDPHVPWERVRESAGELTSLGARVTLKRYPGMPHTINGDEIEEARRLLSSVMREETRE